MNSVIHKSIAECIGNTPVVQINDGMAPNGKKLFVKLEFYNHSFSITDRTALGHELLEAWQAHRGDENRVGMAVDALADGIAWRVVQWAKANDYQPQPPHDPAELVLFGD